MDRALAAVLVATALLFAAIAVKAEGPPSVDPSMSMPVKLPAMTIVATRTAPTTLDAALAAGDWPLVGVFLLPMASLALLRFSPRVSWLHTPAALAVLSSGNAAVVAIAGAVAVRGLSWQVAISALVTWAMTAMAMANASPAQPLPPLPAPLPPPLSRAA